MEEKQQQEVKSNIKSKPYLNDPDAYAKWLAEKQSK
jgi:hypothetical protein